MINANELRIGNWISNGEKNYTVDSNMLYDIANLGVQMFPILLTPEILLKAGFEGLEKGGKRRFKTVGNTVLTIYFEDEELSIQDFDWFEEKLLHIKYLHQLQNLYFALTGEELQIKELNREAVEKGIKF